ncbi:MAG: hypothetical protein OXT72_05560 [Gammaproteobacteria bacterium]|nr:hypothetical protein [Gammaproteobacteria bacterium]MDE0247780.1 hypothetical protein [Gammaproteobacteria bacterium]
MSQGDPMTALLEDWRRRAGTIRQYGGEASARALEACAAELEAALRRKDRTVLTLKDAARATGYSAGHLGRLVRAGTIPNAGRPGAPRIALRHLPRKVRGAASPGTRAALAGDASPPQVSNAEVVRSIIEGKSGE